MKNAVLCIVAALLLSSPAPAPREALVTYAYLPEDAMLYAADGTEICTLPATYFVILEGAQEGDKIPVSYRDLRGYVRADKAEPVDYEPVTKFASVYARPQNDGMAVNLRSAPDTLSSSVLCSVPAGAACTLYGTRTGAELFAGAGTAWCYLRYDAVGGSVFGYAYRAQLDCDAITPNKIEKVQPALSPEITETPESLLLSRTGRIVFAAALCVPAGVLMLALFYRPESARTPRHSAKKP